MIESVGMSKEIGVILLGVAVIVVPYLGVPSAWRTALLLLSGLTLIVIGFLLRSQGMARSGKDTPHQPFVENLPVQAGDVVNIVHDYTAPIVNESHKEGITSLN